VKFHLVGCNYYRDKDSTLCVAPLKYIKRMVDAYKSMLGVATKQNIQLLEEVATWGLVCYLVRMNPEYPGLDESAEYARWRILHLESVD
jgi:hypothetical protein